MTKREYTQLQALNEKYKSQGLEIVGVPCNQFGGQEPGTPEDIEKFVTGKFGVTFDMTEKVDVNGADATPLFVYLKEKNGGMVQVIKWNFTKFLVARDGTPAGRYEPQTPAEELAPKIEELLAMDVPPKL